MTGCAQTVRGGAKRLLVYVGEHNGGTRLSEGLCGGEPHARTGTGNKGNLALEVVRRVHECIASISYVSVQGRSRTLIARRWSMAW